MNITDIMSRDLVTLMPGHSIRHAAQIMLDHHVSGLLVIDGDGKLVGMLTEGDLLRRAEFGPGLGKTHWSAANSAEGNARDFVRSHSWRVGDVMSAPVVTVNADTPIADVALLFGTRGIKRVPVLDAGRLVGVVSRSDLLKPIAETKPEAVAGGDDALRISAEARLRGAGDIFAMCPDVTVAHGVVHLWGRVRSEAERDAARVAVESVHGISGIEDHLTLAHN